LADEEGKASPALAHGPKGRNGPDHFLSWVGRVPVEAARINSKIYHFPFDLFNSNFQFEFKFVKIIGT
jgi:hypothetical protein